MKARVSATALGFGLLVLLLGLGTVGGVGRAGESGLLALTRVMWHVRLERGQQWEVDVVPLDAGVPPKRLCVVVASLHGSRPDLPFARMRGPDSLCVRGMRTFLGRALDVDPFGGVYARIEGGGDRALWPMSLRAREGNALAVIEYERVDAVAASWRLEDAQNRMKQLRREAESLERRFAEFEDRRSLEDR